MQKKPPSSICAAAAIAAALALGSNAALAQDAAPAPDVPAAASPAPGNPPPAAPVAGPTIVSGNMPVVQPLPAVEESAPATTPTTHASTSARAPARSAVSRAANRSATNRSASATPSAAPSPAAAAAAPVPATPLAIAPAPQTAVPLAPVPPAAMDPAPPAQAQQPADVLTSDGLTGAETGLLTLLAAGGLAGAGFLAMRSRRKRDDGDEIGTIRVERAPLTPAPDLAPAPQPRLDPAPDAFKKSMGAAVDGPISTGTERAALLDRMVAAPPDEANPFASLKSRRRRARILLAHREAGAQTGESFDWRSYKSSTAPHVLPAEAREVQPT